MGLSETIYASGKIVSLILVPVLRELAAILLAFAISKDCKARKNGSGVLWGIFTLIMPIFSGIIYFVYSRILVKRKPETSKDKKRVRSSRRMTVVAILIYILSLIIAIVAFVSNIASGIAMRSSDESQGFLSAILEEEFYDRNGVQYDSGEDVLIYDKIGNEYYYAEADYDINNYAYFDKEGNEFDLDYCYISRDGYFYYDENDLLEDTGEWYYYDKHFYDTDGNEYAHIDDYVFWDKNGNIVIRYIDGYRYAFD